MSQGHVYYTIPTQTTENHVMEAWFSWDTTL